MTVENANGGVDSTIPSENADSVEPTDVDAPTDDSDQLTDDELADEWGDESFPSSDPPAHY